MPRYIRAYVAGATYFFTVVLLERQRHLLTHNISALRHAIDATVVRPDHIHCVWTLPPQ